MTCLKKQYTIFYTCTVSLRPQTIVFWRETKTENTCKLFYSVYLTIFIFNRIRFLILKGEVVFL